MYSKLLSEIWELEIYIRELRKELSELSNKQGYVLEEELEYKREELTEDIKELSKEREDKYKRIKKLGADIHKLTSEVIEELYK